MSRSPAAALREADAVPVFAALADATRLRLLRRLSGEGSLSITRLSEGTGVTRQAITRHLYALGGAGLVRHTRRGREQIWDLVGILAALLGALGMKYLRWPVPDR